MATKLQKLCIVVSKYTCTSNSTDCFSYTLWQSTFTSQCDGFTEWASSIDIDCCHLESILSVWSKTINDVTCCHYWLVPLYILVSTMGYIIPYNIASNWPVLLDTRYLSPAEGYFSGLYKHGLQWLWSSWGDWVCNTSLTVFTLVPFGLGVYLVSVWKPKSGSCLISTSCNHYPVILTTEHLMCKLITWFVKSSIILYKFVVAI